MRRRMRGCRARGEATEWVSGTVWDGRRDRVKAPYAKTEAARART